MIHVTLMYISFDIVSHVSTPNFKGCYAQNVEIHQYLVDGINDYDPITTGTVALTLKCVCLSWQG